MSLTPESRPNISLLGRIKEKLLFSLGSFGLILYFAISIVLTFFPLIFLDFGFLIDFLVIVIISTLPLIGSIVNAVIWIWALVVCVQGPQDIFAIVYYTLFVINVLPYVHTFFLFCNQKRQSSVTHKVEEDPMPSKSDPIRTTTSHHSPKAVITSEQPSTVVVPTKSRTVAETRTAVTPIFDQKDSGYFFCPKCNTRQLSNRTRCLDCGTYFDEAAKAVPQVPTAAGFTTQTDIEMSAAALATVTVEAVQTFKNISSSVHLCKTVATETDTILFSCFALRALCIMSTKNRAAAAEFSRKYISLIKGVLSRMNPLFQSFEQFFDERTAFYDRVFAKKQGLQERLSAITEVFEYIIQTDILDNGLSPFSETSPLPLLGIFDATQLRFEINSYIEFLLDYTEVSLQLAIQAVQ